jgi:hypothetical protein
MPGTGRLSAPVVSPFRPFASVGWLGFGTSTDARMGSVGAGGIVGMLTGARGVAPWGVDMEGKGTAAIVGAG